MENDASNTPHDEQMVSLLRPMIQTLYEQLVQAPSQASDLSLKLQIIKEVNVLEKLIQTNCASTQQQSSSATITYCQIVLHVPSFLPLSLYIIVFGTYFEIR